MTRNETKEALKKIIRPLLKEVTMAPSSISRTYQEPKAFLEKVTKALESACDKSATAKFDPSNGKIVLVDCNGGKKFTVTVDSQSDGVYKIVSIVDGGERSVKINQTEENVIDYVKGLKVNDDKETYVGKALDKNAIPEKKEKKDEKASDKSEEVKDIKKQIDHKAVDIKDRKDEELVKGTDGMEVSKKFTKQIDADTKEKVKLKADTKNESDDDLTLKLDGTSKLTKQQIKESMKALLRKKLEEAFSQNPSFQTYVTVSINGQTVPDVGVEVEYQVKKDSLPDRHDRGNVGFDNIQIVSVIATEDIPEFGIKSGQEIRKENIVDIDDLDQKTSDANHNR